MTNTGVKTIPATAACPLAPRLEIIRSAPKEDENLPGPNSGSSILDIIIPIQPAIISTKLVHNDEFDASDQLAGSKNDPMSPPSSNIPHRPKPVTDVTRTVMME